MSSPDRAISLLSETESDGHPADALIVDKARHIAAARETAEHRKKKRRRPLADAQPSAPSPPRHAEADSAKPTGADDGRDRKKRKKASSGSRPSSVSPQPQPSQREDTRRQGKRRKKKAAAAHAVAAGSRHSTEELERLARDAPDGAVLAAINPVVSSSDSETDAEVEIIGVGRSWADETLANGTGRAGAMLPPPGSELSKLAGSAHSAATALAEVHRVTVIGLAAATTPKAAAPIGVRVIGDDEDVTVNSELQRLLRVPRYFDEDFEGAASRCFKCGGSGHQARGCTEEGRARPCYLCAQFGHGSAECPARLCFRCRRPGHIARDCPNSYSNRAMEQAQPVCLRCGRADCPGVTDSVRAAGGCTHDYSKADLAAVRCYVCGRKGHLCCAKVPASTYRPCCYNCGEGGHTADECWRERPPLMRNEQQPALSQGTWGYGRASGDAARYGTNGYDGGAAVRWNGSLQWDSPESGHWQHDRFGLDDGKAAARQRSYSRYHDSR